MKIGIVGSGPAARTLAERWAAQKHDVVLGSETGDAAAAALADVIVFAPEWDHAVALASRLAAALDGKVLLDCTDPGSPEQVDALVTPHRSLAEAIAAAAPGAAVVKLFTTVAAEDIRVTSDPGFNVRDRPTTFSCGDDPEALQIARSLADEIGFETVHVGPLSTARCVESLAGLSALLAAQNSGFELTVRHRGNW